MTETQYRATMYPADFIAIDDYFFPLPIGGKLSIKKVEVASELKTVDGHTRKDIVRTYSEAAVKYETLLQPDYLRLAMIVDALNNAPYTARKKLYIKRESMTMPAPEGVPVRQLFDAHEIDVVAPLKFAYKQRKQGFFVYGDLSLTIN